MHPCASHRSPVFTRFLPLTAFLVAGALLGCLARTAPDGAADSFTAEAEVRPTLEEIFLDPPLSGHAPSIQAISPDGRFLLARWDERPRSERPKGRAQLLLFDLDDPAAAGHRGVRVLDLLPTEAPADDEDETKEGEAKPVEDVGACVWSHEGSLLAIARRGDVYLHDPRRGETAALLLHEVEEKNDDEEDEPDDERADSKDEEPDPNERRLGHVRSLAFAPDDRSLRFADRNELFSLPVDGLPASPKTLAESTWVSEDLDAPALKLRWSLDLSVAFGEEPTPRSAEDHENPHGSEAEALSDDDEAPAAPEQVYRLREGRGVTLAGMADEEWMERMAISPDGRFVAGVAYDRSAEPEAAKVPDYLTERVSMREARRLSADALPSPFEIWVWNTSSGTRKRALPSGGPHTSLPEVEESDEDTATEDDEPPPDQALHPTVGAAYWLRTIGWAPQPEDGSPARFAFELYAQDFRELEIWCWTEGFCERIWTERDEQWIGGPARNARWSSDGRVLLVGSESYAASPTPGRCQIFAVDPGDLEVHALTEVEGEVDRFQPVAGGGVVFEASREDAARRAVGWIPPEALAWKGGGPSAPVGQIRWYPVPAGYNERAAGSRGGERIAFLHERLHQPAELWVATPERAYRVSATRPSSYDEVDWIEPQRIERTSSDDRTVRAHVFLPPGMALGGANTPRASIVFVHGAGYLQNVTDSMTRYPLNLMFHSRLARLGYPVIDVDYRGSKGYGQAFRTDVQFHLGGKDLEDIHLIVDALVAEGIVDPERVGIYGGSYGGFLTMMALFTAPERWAAGAALRSVTDWRTYNPWYTQPRLGRPSTHAEAYECSSPIDHAERLEDPLLILHGMVDTNVFAQDSIRMIEKLIDLGKDFEAMLYPSQGHAFQDGEHWLDEYRRIERFLIEHLGAP